MSERAMQMATAKLRGSDGGLTCPGCLAPSTRVIDTRASADGFCVRRRRICTSCAHRFTTYEATEHPRKHAEIANIRTAHLDLLIAQLKTAIDEYEEIRTHPIETWADPEHDDGLPS